MRRIILQDQTHIYPFNEPARDLRVHNVPLWLWQQDRLGPYIQEEREYPDLESARRFEAKASVETLIHSDNIFFNQSLIDEFIQRGKASGKPVRLAFKAQDPAILEHVLPLTHSFSRKNNLLLARMWYLPHGFAGEELAEPLVIDTEAREVGYYHVPPYMSNPTGDLTYQLPRKSFVSIESWAHLFIVDILFGVFARGKNEEDKASENWRHRLKILLTAVIEQKQVLDCSRMVRVGQNVIIDPSAVIHGPTTIGNNVTIGPGAFIDNCVIGDNVNISQGCQLMLSVVSDGCFLPFRAALFMTTLMENTMVAQNTCLQMCVVGRDTFIGAGSTFTDFRLIPGELRAATTSNGLQATGMPVLGGCVGHHCRLSSGLVIYPARTVESDVVLLADSQNHFITSDIRYEDSSHLDVDYGENYPRLYPRAKDGS